MVDSILTNQAPIITRPADNRSMTTSAVSNASSVPEVEVEEEIIDVSPRSMDTDPESLFKQGSTRVKTPLENFNPVPVELRPSLENFGPMEMTGEKALENRVADIEIRDNNDIDETSSIVSVNNNAIEAFRDNESMMQQSVDLTA